MCFEIRPLRQQSTPGDLCTAGRAHLDAKLAFGAVIESIDYSGPVSYFSHVFHPARIHDFVTMFSPSGAEASAPQRLI
jgi:hypothetical protein